MAALALLCWLPSMDGLAQDAAAPAAWAQQWNDLYARDDLEAGERLAMQTELVRQSGAATGWRNAAVWDWTRQVLAGWEGSADLDRAYAAYLSILEDIGVAAQADDAALPDEAALRDYYQRALTIARTPAEEGRLLLYLAESLLRSQPDSAEARRRAEACLQQATLALVDEPPIDAVHLRLAQLYAASGDAAVVTPEGEESHLSQVVFHYRYILELANAREPYRAAAEAALDALLQPGLEMRIGNRFLPANEIRIAFECRNLAQVSLEIHALPWPSPDGPTAHARMAEAWLSSEPAPEALVLEKTVTIAPRQRYDWETHEIRLSEDFNSGWYRVRIRAGDLEAQDLMLVTPLEVTAIPGPGGRIAIWVADAETGQPVPGAAFHVLGAAGELLQTGVCDGDGLGTVSLPDGTAWQEIHVSDGLNPALVRAEEARDPRQEELPWIIPAANTVRPGETLAWMLMGGAAAQAGSSVHLPDGTMLAATITETGPQVALGSVMIPAGTTASGPLLLELPDLPRIHLAHLDRITELPLAVELSGERCESGTHLFLASSPVRVRISRSSLTDEPAPEYLRVRVAAINREPPQRNGQRGAPAQAVTLHESILRFGGAEGGAAHFDLPDVGDSQDVRILRIEVHALDLPDLLGQAHLALLPYRTLVRLRLDQQLVRMGDTVRVNIDPIRASEAGQRSAEGELVVFRETWESRYIHRKKGTLISEAEFTALPDRSLLGSAKTDYRLLEQGFLREEVARITVDAAGPADVPIPLERAGSYRIEFEGRDSETRPAYPEGPLEVWVIPDPLDLRAFRSDAPRLVVERDADGSQQVLVLLDRKEVSVLLDMEHADGSVVTRVLKPVDNALYVEAGADSGALTRARAVVVGDRQTDLLCGRIVTATPVRWNLEADRSVGLNPGTAFDWRLEPVDRPAVRDAVYVFYPDLVTRPLFSFLEWQQHARRARLHASDPAIASLGKWLPVYHPLVLLDTAPATAAEPMETPTPDRLLNLYPELIAARPVRPGNLGFNRLTAGGTGGSVPVSGTLPDAAGRWSFTVLSLSGDGHLDWQGWPLSTELPIRSTLSGAPLVRAGDQPLALLALENTTRGQAQLDVEFTAEGSIQLTGTDSISRELAQRRREEIPVGLSANAAGPGTVRALARGRNSTSEASLALTVEGAAAQPVLLAHVVPSGAANWTRTARIAGWQQPRLVVSAGLGTVLPEIWPLLRQQLAADPLLAALGDWALERASSRQGMGAGANGGSAAALLDPLQRFQSGGGWSWIPGQAPDPWLSALVLWTLETFSNLADEDFENMRAAARDYLESALVDETLPMDARLAALHALAAPAYNDPRVRPSRIQARTFLSLLHDRDQLSHAGFAALLQVARAYHFSEEVRLLAPELTERVRTRGIPLESGFHARTLIHMAFGEIPGAEALRASVLQGAIESLSTSGVRRSWLQLGGFLNLLATFLWEGDFSVEGRVAVTVDGAPPVNLELAPDRPGNGCLKLALPAGEAVNISLDAASTRLPVLVLLLGGQPAAPVPPDYPEQAESLLREYIETTLLAGQRQEVDPLQDPVILHRGDILQVVLTLYAETPEPFGELHFMIPAGASLAADAIQHSFEASSTEAIFNPPQLVHLEQVNPLRQVLRMAPMLPGRHEFILSYRINWPGTFAFPAHLLYLPRSGQAFRFGTGRRVEFRP